MPYPRYQKANKNHYHAKTINNNLEFSEELTDMIFDYVQKKPVPQKTKEFGGIEF
ncbi:hypothetical protein [Calidifontibacillus erzurumensis]|uniref:Uncharacterized protein n=1 Tax=Calidifontibacillus erzurumensis TaxID=2741433 RepID=A0A8J8KBS7_9BACI|nr:hypothetical protein [Calidifontibacillus erzurumensis]NSL52254.1 hypothetical protein [Calidifontibacillus erzurumensis]